MKQLEELVNDGYEDLTISKKNLIELIEKYSHNIPLYINNRKVWIHFTESDKIFMECDISDGSGVELNIEEI
jgi:hypothetical protein|tara:strand:- start:1277 stop:1492 length:216 start_codon:yes stop_codon:yes gene_type:complete